VDRGGEESQGYNFSHSTGVSYSAKTEARHRRRWGKKKEVVSGKKGSKTTSLKGRDRQRCQPSGPTIQITSAGILVKQIVRPPTKINRGIASNRPEGEAKKLGEQTMKQTTAVKGPGCTDPVQNSYEEEERGEGGAQHSE